MHAMHYLFVRPLFPPEAHLVNGEMLAEIARELNLGNYLRDLYQHPGIADTVNLAVELLGKAVDVVIEVHKFSFTGWWTEISTAQPMS